MKNFYRLLVRILAASFIIGILGACNRVVYDTSTQSPDPATAAASVTITPTTSASETPIPIATHTPAADTAVASVTITPAIIASKTPIPTGKKSPTRAPGVIERDVIDLEYESSDGYKLRAILSIPKGSGPFPVIVTIHGGKGEQDLKNIRTLATGDVSPTVQMLNDQPWAILSIDYRGGAILGMEEDDVVAGIRFAKTLDRIDPTRVGVLGGSHGGHLTLRAAEVMGNEISGAAAGSPWMTNPQLYLYGDYDTPPLSEISPAARETIEKNRPLARGLEKKYGMDGLAKLIAERSIEWNAENIMVPVLFLTSNGDVQVPHILVQPTIERLQAAGKDVTVYTAEKSVHGFYWGRDIDGGARSGLGKKTDIELQEEEMARQYILAFFRRVFGED